MIRQAPTERVAGYAFFLFTLIQVPFFIAESNVAPSGLIMLSPLQVTVANLARIFPQHAPVLEYVLVPGGWMREAVSPFIRCQYKTSGKGPCAAEQAKLGDLQQIVLANNLPLLVALLESDSMAQQTAILYGCAMIVVSALFSLYYSVKTAVLGFMLLGYGIVQGDHTPLPPSILMAFLCVYAGFNLGEVRGNARTASAARHQQTRAAPPAAAAAGSSSPAKALSRKAEKKQQRKQA